MTTVKTFSKCYRVGNIHLIFDNWQNLFEVLHTRKYVYWKLQNLFTLDTAMFMVCKNTEYVHFSNRKKMLKKCVSAKQKRKNIIICIKSKKKNWNLLGFIFQTIVKMRYDFWTGHYSDQFWCSVQIVLCNLIFASIKA